MVSTYRKEARNKRKQFPLERKSLSISGNKVFLKKMGHQFQWRLPLKEKKREKGFCKTENPSPPYGMKNSIKNTFPLDEKYLSLAGISEKWKKLTSTGQKISFHKHEKTC